MSNRSSERAAADSSREFGGSMGALAIIVLSHVAMLYLWLAWRFWGGAVPLPRAWDDIAPFVWRVVDFVVVEAAPTWEACAIYGSFLALQALLAVALPGLEVRGLPVASRGGRRLSYLCNGISAWYLTLFIAAGLHFSGVFALTAIADRFGSLMTVAMLTGNAVALATYFGAHLTGNTHRASGHRLQDFFMGIWLNPRLGRLDLKMWSEIRISWMLLFLLTASAAAQQYARWGTVSTPMIFMLLAHWLYANACMKGEECIPYTWDIFHENWGWMLIFWNFAGVPFVYCFNAYYLASRPPVEHSIPYTVMCFVLLLGAYYVWDTSQSQRNRFRMRERGTYVPRRTFPQLPWATLHDPRYLETASGSKLLIDGWWRWARKIHYTADVVMALSWGLICGFESPLPYAYVVFFVLMIAHRARRDGQRCARKYGADWQRYCRIVPRRFVPGLF